jgi:hypothetical protein
MTGKAEQKSFEVPDETRTFDFGAMDLLQIGGAEIGRLTLQPGWRWSDHVKPLAGTDLCEAPHCHRAMTPGWWETSRSSSWTGSGPATTPAPEGRRLSSASSGS